MNTPPNCPGCGAGAELRGGTWWRLPHADDCPFVADPEAFGAIWLDKTVDKPGTG